MDELLVAIRLIHFAAVMLVFGSTAFRLYALSGVIPAASGKADALPAFDAWLGSITGGGAVVSLLSAVALLLGVTATMTGSIVAALDWETVGTVLLGTAFGHVWSWHLLLAAAVVVVATGRRRRHVGLRLALAALLLASLGWVGHAAMATGPAGMAHEVNQALHLLAAGLWLGGLVPLAWLIRQVRRRRRGDWYGLVREALPQFSRMGYCAVAALAVTGAVNSVLLVGGFGALFETPYGRLLAVKISLFLAMVGVALGNRFRLAPRILDESAPVDMLARAIFAEQALGLAVLAVVSVLGTWPPAAGGGAM